MMYFEVFFNSVAAGNVIYNEDTEYFFFGHFKLGFGTKYMTNKIIILNHSFRDYNSYLFLCKCRLR